MKIEIDSVEVDLKDIENEESPKQLRAAGFIFYSHNAFQRVDFRDKRFRRYVSKVEQLLTDTVNSALTLYDRPLYETSIIFCLRYWRSTIDKSIIIKNTPAELIRSRVGNMFRKTNSLMEQFMEDDLSIKKLKGSLAYMENDYTDNPENIHSKLRQLYEINRDNCIVDMLVEQHMKETIKPINYTTYMPSLLEQVVLYANIMTRLAYDIEDVVCEDLMEAVFTGYKNRLLDEVSDVDRIVTLQDRLENAQRTLYQTQMERMQFQQDIEAYKAGIDTQRKKYEAQLTEKDNKIHAMEQKMKSMAEKYERLKASVTEAEVEKEANQEAEQMITPEDCDVTKNYKFIMSPWPLFEGQLKETFPNMTVVPGMEVIMKETTDLVIFMASHMSHKFYKGIKNQCQDKKIPYIHFNSTNIDKLKVEIAKKLVQNFEE